MSATPEATSGSTQTHWFVKLVENVVGKSLTKPKQGKIHHQLSQAYQRNARKIWVFNVGDIKPIELPLTFAMEMAWNINSIHMDTIPQFLGHIATNYFGSALSPQIVFVWYEYDRLVRIRKHEHIDPESFSLLHYNEADNIVTRWKDLESRAELIYKQVAGEQKPAFWELVVHPVKASSIFTQLRVVQARNQLYARQRRNTANKLLRQALDHFDADFKLSQEFHSLLDGKWNYMLCQPHMGYGDTWHAPSRDAIFGLAYVQRHQNSNIIVGQMGVAVEGHEGVRAGRINEESERTHPSRRDLVPGLTLGPMSRYGPTQRWFDIFTRGTQIIHWTASAPHPWIQLSEKKGTLSPDGDDVRVWIMIDWDQVPVQFDEEILVTIVSKEGDFEHVHLPVYDHKVPESFRGFVESDGCVSIPASGVEIKAPYQHHPELGRSSEGAVTIKSPLLREGAPPPFLEYPIYIFSRCSPALTLIFNMTLDIDPANPMSYAIAVDNETPHHHLLLPKSQENRDKLPAEGWLDAVMDCVWKRDHAVAELNPAAHIIQIRLNHPNLLLEKIVLDLGGVKECYLGPPPSLFVS
jgi:hypothetical protein